MLSHRLHGVLPLLVVFFFAACSPQPKGEQFITGKIWTGNLDSPWAGAMVINGDSIVAIGSAEELQHWVGSNTRIEKHDSTELIVPGLIDCHTHFVEGGMRLSSVQLRDAKTPAEFIRRIAAYAKTLKPGEWILGGDWDHQHWGGSLPKKEWVDSVTRDNPLWVQRLDGHMGLANSLALQRAGITENTRDVAGGAIVREKGKITGILKDNATKLVDRHIPAPTAEQFDRALQAAMQYVASNGITSIHSVTGSDYGNSFDVFERAKAAGKLITRIYAADSLSAWSKLREQINKNGRGDNWVKYGMLKGFVDGSLGSHTAAFWQPFTDAPQDSGFYVIHLDTLYQYIQRADKAGLQVTVHAIGDKSISKLLDIFERVEKENGPRDRRFRMEHAQHIRLADLPRFAQLGVIASVQPYHAIDDGRWAEKFIGHERALTTYAFQSLLAAKAKLAFGSDWFVAPASPMEGIYAAVTRRTIDDKNPDGWIPSQKTSVEDALRAYTMGAAFASFDEHKKGSLEKGKLADFTVLEKNIFSIAPETIRTVRVLETVVGGKTVFQQKK